MKSILCALDFSESSFSVIKKALALAAQRKGALTFLFAYRLVQPIGSALGDYRKSTETNAKKNFDALVKKIKINSTVPYEFRSEIGFISDRIDAFMKKNDVELIVIAQDMVDLIDEHKGFSLEDHIREEKIPLVIVPDERVES